MAVIDKFYDGDIRSLSRIISFVEDRRAGYRKLLTRLYQAVGHSLRIGITGPPGAGKSTLVSGLIHELLKEKQKVGIIAVDPTSPFTGGALLGDRVRMNDFPPDGRVYFRSMATRGASGGLTAATNNVTVVYDAFGFDVTIIETVGVGQVELDIVDACDVVVVVVVPESGDAVQTMKAGLSEIADIFCVNKADRPGSDRIISDLRQSMELRKTEEGAWRIPVIPTEAVSRKNVEVLAESIDDFVKQARSSGRFDSHRRGQIRNQIESVLQDRFRREFVDRLANEVQFDQIVDKIAQGQADPYTVGEELYTKFSPDS